MKSTPPAFEDLTQGAIDTPGRAEPGRDLARLLNDPRASESSKLYRKGDHVTGPGWLGRREDGRLVPLAMDRFGRFTLISPPDPTRQGGLEAWPNGER